MEKLKLQTPDLGGQNVGKLAQLFPNCVTELQDEQGRITRAIDFDHQPNLAAEEIDDVGIDWMLAAKFESCGAPAQLLPKHDLGESHFSP